MKTEVRRLLNSSRENIDSLLLAQIPPELVVSS